jgi:WD40 repeat protein
LAHQAWQSGDIGRVLDLLDGLRPAGGQPDLRGFEWYYLRWLCHRERLTLHGQIGPVKSVAFAPGGKLIATANRAKVVLCDAATGQMKATLSGHVARVLCVAFSPDGTRIASGSEDKTVRIWDVATGRELAMLEGHSGPIGSLAFAPDGRALATASGVVLATVGNPIDCFVRPGASEVRLWRAGPGKGQEWAATQVVAASAFGLAFAPDGRTLATADAAATVTLWDTATGQRRRVLTGHRGPVFTVAFTPDGKSLASGSYDQSTRIWNVDTSQQQAVSIRHSGAIFAVAFTPDGKMLASGGYDQTVSLCDVSTGQERGRIRGHTGRVWSVAFAPDGKTLATASENGTARIWDPHEPQDHDSLDGRWAIWGHGAFTVAFAPDGKVLATTTSDVKLWDVASRERIALLGDFQNRDIHVTFAPDGRTIAAGGIDGLVVLCDATTRQVRVELPRHPKAVWSLAFTPDSRTLASGSEDGIIRLWDPVTGQPRGQLDAGTGSYVRALGYSHDGRTQAAAYHLKDRDQSALLLWDAASGRIRATLRGHTRLIEWVAFAPDGQTLASGGWDRTVRLWEVSSGQSQLVLTGHMDVIYDGAFSPDRRTLATASWDGTVRLWHVATGQELALLRSRTGEFWCAAFAADGKTLAAGSSSRHAGSEVSLWRAAPVAESAEPARQPFAADPMLLKETRWSIAVDPQRTPEEYRPSVRYLEAACRLVPQEGRLR